MPAGFRLKGESAAEVVPEEIPTEQGLEHVRSAIERLQTESQRRPHPAFGAMSQEEWEQLHLRHAELHMSFITEA